MSDFKTEQEKFWSGEFGDEYTSRNISDEIVASNTALFSKILSRTHGVESIIEFGANLGINMRAIRNILPMARLEAIEINKKAAAILEQWGGIQNVYNESILNFKPQPSGWDVSLIKGVMIHIDPKELEKVYEILYIAARKYIILVEYFNPTPVELPYRGHSGKLFKRDFASELLEKYPDLKVVDYGFVWRKDPVFPLDDANWFLLSK